MGPATEADLRFRAFLAQQTTAKQRELIGETIGQFPVVQKPHFLDLPHRGCGCYFFRLVSRIYG